VIGPGRADTVDFMLPSAVCAALADRERLRLFGAICREPDGVAAAGLALSPGGRRAMGRLLGAGLVQRDGEMYVVRAETFLQALRAAPDAAEPGAGAEGATDRVAALFSRGRLVSMPRPGELRSELLRWLAERFEHGRTYREADIRSALEPYYDHAVLRRYLVDEGVLERDNHGSYWRPDRPRG
jgi:hypothetical protein